VSGWRLPPLDPQRGREKAAATGDRSRARRLPQDRTPPHSSVLESGCEELRVGIGGRGGAMSETAERISAAAPAAVSIGWSTRGLERAAYAVCAAMAAGVRVAAPR